MVSAGSASPILFTAMKAVAQHYRHLSDELAPAASGVALPEEVHAVKELDSSAREDVIRRLLKRREEVLFSGGVRDAAPAPRGR